MMLIFTFMMKIVVAELPPVIFSSFIIGLINSSILVSLVNSDGKSAIVLNMAIIFLKD